MKIKCKISGALRKEIDFLASLARRCPRDIDVLKAVGDLYTRAEYYEEGLQTDLALTRLCPLDPLVWYNLACSYALLDRTDEALSTLEQAIALGYRDVRWIREDRDLNSLKKDKRFDRLLQRLGP